MIWEGANFGFFLKPKAKPGDRPLTVNLPLVAEGFPGMRIVFLLFIFLLGQVHCFASTTTIVPPVVVKGKRSISHSLTHAPKIIINRRDLAASGATSLAQALQELGGVQLQDTTGNGSQVLLSMRGFGANASSNTLLLINGIPITNPDMAPPDLNSIPLQEIELIEIIAGSESVLYGDQAVGGSINIITRKEYTEKIALTCSGGSYNTHNCYATFQNHIRKLGIGLNLVNYHSDNYRDNNNYDQNLLSGRFGYPYQTGRIDFDYQIAKERMQYPGGLTAAQVEQNRRQAKNDTDFFADNNGSFNLHSEQNLGFHWRLDTDIARRQMDGNGVLTSDFNQSRTINFFKPQLKGPIGRALLTTGLDVEDDRYHLDSLFGTTNDSEQKYGLFGILNYPISQRLNLSLGARGAQLNNKLDSFQNNNTRNRAIATTLGGTYELNPGTKIYLRRAENFRFPKADENASTPLDIKALKTQRGVSYETGVNWNWKRFTSKLGLYQLNLRDEITFDPTQTPEQPFGANRNLDPTVRVGLSFSEKFHLTDLVTLDGQYNYVDAKFQSGPNAGNRIPLVSKYIFRGGVNYKIDTHWNFYSETIYTGNQYAANNDANIDGPIAGYMIYNFNLRYQFNQFSAAFRVNNIFDKDYNFYSVFQTFNQTETFYPAPRRNFLMTVKYAFV